MSKITQEDIAKYFNLYTPVWDQDNLQWYWRALDTKKRQLYQGWIDKKHKIKATAKELTKVIHNLLLKTERKATHPGHGVDKNGPKKVLAPSPPNLKKARIEQEYKDEVATQNWIESLLPDEPVKSK